MGTEFGLRLRIQVRVRVRVRVRVWGRVWVREGRAWPGAMGNGIAGESGWRVAPPSTFTIVYVSLGFSSDSC